jgi:hypothetical protein
MIEYSDHFLKEAKQLAKKYHKLKDDLKQAVHEIETQQDLGTALGVNLFKKQVRNSSIPTGKSGGFRTSSSINKLPIRPFYSRFIQQLR